MRYRKEINMNWLVIIFMVSATGMVLGNDIYSKVKEYYQLETTTNFKKIWSNFQISYENALNLALQTGYGRRGMNVFVNKFTDTMELAKGFYHNDNQVSVLLHRLTLQEVPQFHNVDVTFPLSSNMIALEATVSDIILQANYLIFRNNSDLIYADRNAKQSSPFKLQQVAPKGNIAITLSDCTLQGYGVVTLVGKFVNLGHLSFRLRDCQHISEINGDVVSKGPPVIANYYFNGIGINLDTLILPPLLSELKPKLEGALYSYVKTDDIFMTNLPKIRAKQEYIFQETRKYEDSLIRCMIKRTLESDNMGAIEMRNFDLTVQDSITDSSSDLFTVSKVLLVGLDTLYSSHSGGPVDSDPLRYAQQFRFKTFQITGKVGKTSRYHFAAEITDLTVNVEMDKLYNLTYTVMGWRVFEFSTFHKYVDFAEEFVVAYLQKELPNLVIAHLNTVHLSCQNSLRNKE